MERVTRASEEKSNYDFACALVQAISEGNRLPNWAILLPPALQWLDVRLDTARHDVPQLMCKPFLCFHRNLLFPL
jgi:hypothetical protein